MQLKAVQNKTLAGPFLYCIQDEQGRTVAGANSPELARLIEGAPGLLEACKQAFERMELSVMLRGGFIGDDYRAIENMRAAITQATSV